MANTEDGMNVSRLAVHAARLLEQQGAKVTTLDYAELADQKKGSEKIDMTILRANMLTLVEFRGPDIEEAGKWLFGLARKRQYLKANAAIAVHGGEIDPALHEQAEEKGILLRALGEVSKAEIADWGRPVEVRLLHMAYRTVRLRAAISVQDAGRVQDHPSLCILGDDRDPVSLLLLHLRDRAADGLTGEWTHFEAELSVNLLALGDIPLVRLEAIYDARQETEKSEISSIITHDYKDEAPDAKASKLLADLSMFEQKPNRILRHIAFDGPRILGAFDCRFIGVSGIENAPFSCVTLDVVTIEETPVVAQAGAREMIVGAHVASSGIDPPGEEAAGGEIAEIQGIDPPLDGSGA